MKIPMPRLLFVVIIGVILGYGIIVLFNKVYPQIFYSGVYSLLLYFSLLVVLVALWFVKGVYFIGELTPKEMEAKKNDGGLFFYYEQGFVYDKKVDIKWGEIIKVIIAKNDNVVIDTLSILIEATNAKFSITEDDKGWNVFIEKLQEVLIEDLHIYLLTIKDNSSLTIYDKNVL